MVKLIITTYRFRNNDVSSWQVGKGRLGDDALSNNNPSIKVDEQNIDKACSEL